MSLVDPSVLLLEQHSFDDSQPSIESRATFITVDTTVDSGYSERSAFDCKWAESVFAISRITDNLKRGEEFINVLYTYRSCSKALPTSSAENHELLVQALEPEIEKLRKFLQFQRETVELFVNWARLFVQDKKIDIIPEAVLGCLGKVLDLLSLLDSLKNMKASFNNDFALFKRALQHSKSRIPDELNASNMELQNFLASQNSIFFLLKAELGKLPGCDDFLLQIVNLCASQMENSTYVLPQEKFCLLRVLTFGLQLLDEVFPDSNIFKNKKIPIQRYAALIKLYPVVPLYGDMQISLEANISRSKNFVEKTWGGLSDNERTDREYQIIHHLPQIRLEHSEYIAKFTTMTNNIKINLKRKSPADLPSNICTFGTNMVLEGLKLLSNWSARVLQQSAWKYARPNTDPSLEQLVEYERVVKHNYRPEELFALAEVIGLMKGLGKQMAKEDTLLSMIIRRTVYEEVQSFARTSLDDFIAAAQKKKRPVADELYQLKHIIADQDDGLGIKKKGAEDEAAKKFVAPSLTQHELLRTALYHFFGPRLSGKKAYSDKDLSKQALQEIETLYARSFYYPHLLDYSGAIRKMTDLADLWYREFYLDLTKRLQFEIDLSLPWILVDKILETRNVGLIEYILYPLDIYNDAANRALNSLHQKYLYEEIEAEVNLSIDQLTFKLSDVVYNHYKLQVSTMMLDPGFRLQAENVIVPAKSITCIGNHFHVILNQRHFHLLGRSVDLNLLISQRINNLIRANIDNAISRFQAQPLSHIAEFEMQLNAIKLTHSLLSQHLQLDPFNTIFAEVNESASLVSYHSRVIFHVLSELLLDVFPNYSYNQHTQRYIRSPSSLADEYKRAAMPKSPFNFLYGNKNLTLSFKGITDLHNGFIGQPHFKAIARIIGVSNMPLLIEEILSNLDNKIQTSLIPYYNVLKEAMPPSSKLPRFDYRTKGTIGFFQAKLLDIIKYSPLQSEVFQQYREFGNAVCFFYHLDKAVGSLEGTSKIMAAPLLGVRPTRLNIGEIEAQGKPVRLSKVLEDFANSDQLKPKSVADVVKGNANIAARFYGRDSRFSVLKVALERLNQIVWKYAGDWAYAFPEEGAVIPVDNTSEFYRMWSVFQFIFCFIAAESSQAGTDPFHLFGDGFFWAGATIIHCLQQRDRFLSFDFSQHIINVSQVFEDPELDRSSAAFLSNARRVSNLVSLVFRLLEVNLPPAYPQINLLMPPSDDTALQTFKIITSLRESGLTDSGIVSSSSTSSSTSSSSSRAPVGAPASPAMTAGPIDPLAWEPDFGEKHLPVAAPSPPVATHVSAPESPSFAPPSPLAGFVPDHLPPPPPLENFSGLAFSQTFALAPPPPVPDYAPPPPPPSDS